MVKEKRRSYDSKVIAGGDLHSIDTIGGYGVVDEMLLSINDSFLGDSLLLVVLHVQLWQRTIVFS
jgi:hypothetical protein